MKRAFYISCAINGILAGVLLSVCGGLRSCHPAYLMLTRAYVKKNVASSSANGKRLSRPKAKGVNDSHNRVCRKLEETPAARTQTIYPALSLLWAAESSNGKQMVGDGGAAIGHFQQHEGHWRDGCEALGVNWPLSDRYNLARASAVTAASWARYARQDLYQNDVEVLIRRHRLPNDPLRPSNDAYVARVMKGAKP